MQEPITLGSASLSGHLGLSKLIVFYDSNEVQISGGVSRSDSTDYGVVFKGFGWHVQKIDGHEPIWVWAMTWTGPATDSYNRNVPFIEEAIIGLLNGGVWELKDDETD